MVFHGSLVSWRGWGQSVMKLIQCSALTWIYGQWKIIWCNGLPEIHAQLTGGPSAKVGLSTKFCTHLSFMLQCSGLTWIYGQLGEGGQSAIDPCYTITPSP